MAAHSLTRRSFLGTSAAALAIRGLTPVRCRAAETPAIDIAHEPQLFLDDEVIADSRGFRRTLHKPEKKGLILEADGHPWERGGAMSVVRDASGRFHMTYRFLWEDPSVRDLHPGIGRDKAHWFRRTVGYARSNDGIHWSKPVLGLVEGPTGFRRAPEGEMERRRISTSRPAFRRRTISAVRSRRFTAWIPHHTEEHGFDRLVFPGTPVRVGNELWLYYCAWDGDHLNWNRDGTTYYKDRTRIERTALATLRWDGFVSLDAGDRPAELVTKPLRFQGKATGSESECAEWER